MLVGKNSEEVNVRLEEWKKGLESKELRMCRGKIEYITYDFEENKYLHK